MEENELLKKALEFTEVSLAGKKRNSGELVLDHCLKVARILERYKINDPATLTVAILHHSLHEGAANIGDIKQEFGDDIATMMESFEKLRMIKPREEMGEAFAENLRKMFLVLAKDLRVVMIKLADILDNLTTLDYVDIQKKEEVSRKTLEIFAPLAERLGMGEMRGEMQDLAFMHLYPEEYRWVKKISKSQLLKLSKELPKVRAKLFKELAAERVVADLQSRIKHSYSLYTKLLRPEIDRDISKIFDLMAMRIIVNTKEECYKVMGIVNKTFRLYEEKVSDFIAHPKPNGYQSIHMKVYGPSNLPFEIQIRTEIMHEEAEYGVAAHWNYTEQKEKGMSDEKISKGFATSAEKLEWVKRLSDWQNEIKDNQEFLKTVKIDLFGQRIYVFTPKGDVKDLPKGSTPVDFAYKIHTALGDKSIGAKVNGKMVPLDYKLKDADVVEIIVSKDQFKKPNRDWLSFVMTPTARKKIKKEYYSK